MNCGVNSLMKDDHRSYIRNFDFFDFFLFQFRKESLKKFQACTGFEPLTSAISVVIGVS